MQVNVGGNGGMKSRTLHTLASTRKDPPPIFCYRYSRRRGDLVSFLYRGGSGLPFVYLCVGVPRHRSGMPPQGRMTDTAEMRWNGGRKESGQWLFLRAKTVNLSVRKVHMAVGPEQKRLV